MRIRDLQERDAFIPDDGGDDNDDGGLEDRINQALRQVGKPSEELWADVDPKSGVISVYILHDNVIKITAMQLIEEIVTEYAPAYFIGVSGGAQQAVYLHYQIDLEIWAQMKAQGE